MPSDRDRVITGPNGILDILTRAILTGGKKYSITTNDKRGEEKLKLFSIILTSRDQLTVIGYSFGDEHVNNRIINAMVLNPNLKIVIVDPVSRPWPNFLRQFDYNLRLRSAACGAAQWITYLTTEKWDNLQIEALKSNQGTRARVSDHIRRRFSK